GNVRKGRAHRRRRTFKSSTGRSFGQRKAQGCGARFDFQDKGAETSRSPGASGSLKNPARARGPGRGPRKANRGIGRTREGVNSGIGKRGDLCVTRPANRVES